MNNLIKAMIKYFMAKIPGEPKKKRISLKGCILKDACISTFTSIIDEKQYLKTNDLLEIDLSFNYIGDDACESLSTLIDQNFRIKKMNLGRNMNIGNRGFEAIMTAIRQNNHITCLDFSVCNLVYEGNTKI